MEGTRISVLDIKRRVIEHDEGPFAVASEYDIDVASVFAALAYYYEELSDRRALERIHDESKHMQEQVTGEEFASQ